MADADNYASGVGGGGGSGWEVVSLTASTYAAAPGPVLPLLLDSHEKTELPSPADSAAIFMSQHFNLPADALLTDLNGLREEEESFPAMVDDDAAGTEDLNMQSDRQTEMQDDGLTLADFSGDLQEGGGLVGSAVEERLSTILCSPDAAGSDIRTTTHHRAAADVIVVDSASLPAAHVAPAVSVSSGAASVTANKGPSSKIPCEAHAWWNKTFSFLRSNSKQSLTFRFVFVAATIAGLAILGQRDKLQLRLEFNVDSEKISCAVREPLGQVKLNMLVGGIPVAQG